MKKIILKALIVLASGIIAVSCINDLDAYPFNEDDFTSEDAYGSEYSGYVSGLAKIYNCFNSTSGLTVDDAGASELVRAFWAIQECSSDGCKNDWEKDAWTQDINKNTWSTADNAATYAVYCRTLHGITYANEFLRQTSDDRLTARGCSQDVIDRVHSLRAEARFLRAFMYWVSIDTFGDVPFVTEESEFGSASPDVKTRSEVFSFLVRELEELINGNELGAALSNYPRADKGSALGLLTRLYLNSPVYNSKVDEHGKVVQKGADMSKECVAACEEIFKLNYKLCRKYSDLFRGDNGENPEARSEMLFVIDYDEVHMNSWGGTIFLAQSCFQAADDVDDQGNPMYSLGVKDGWAGIRMPSEYVFDYFGVTVPENGYGKDGKYTGVYNFTDDRASMFYIKNHYENMTDLSEFTQGWSYYKFNNIPHDMTKEEFASTAISYGTTSAKCGIDFPFLRLGEIYLTYAEACLATGDKSKGLDKLNDIRERAHLARLSDYTLEDVQKERAVELSWEAIRRTDLIRWDLYNSGTFLWRWKGGSYEGQGFSPHLLVFDFPQAELIANSKLSHKPGYAN